MYTHTHTHTHTHTQEYYSTRKKNEIAVCSNMDRSRVCQTEWNKSDREREASNDIAYKWDLKRMIQVNLQNRNRLTSIENKFMVTKGEKVEGEINQELGLTSTHYYILSR